MAKKLPEKYILFVKNYIIDHNATRAAKLAGYSEKTAYSQGNRLLKNVEIKKLIEDEEAKIAKRLEISAANVLKELAKIAFSNVTDYVKISNYLGRLERYNPETNMFENIPVEKQEITFVDTDSLSDIQKAAISEIGYGKYGPYVKTHDKLKALTKLGEHLGVFGGKDEEQEDIEESFGEVFDDGDKED